MKATFHYCGLYQPTAGQVSYVDGVCSSVLDLKEQENYDQLKQQIIDTMNLMRDGEKLLVKQFSITSLSIIGLET